MTKSHFTEKPKEKNPGFSCPRPPVRSVSAPRGRQSQSVFIALFAFFLVIQLRRGAQDKMAGNSTPNHPAERRQGGQCLTDGTNRSPAGHHRKGTGTTPRPPPEGRKKEVHPLIVTWLSLCLRLPLLPSRSRLHNGSICGRALMATRAQILR